MNTRWEDQIGSPIDAKFFKRCVDDVSADLVGCFLFNKVDGDLVGGQIIEVEAYCQSDPAAHCYSDKRDPDEVLRGLHKTRMHDAMYRPAGYLYVFPNSSYCHLNFVCGRPGFGSGALVRALRPLESCIKKMEQLRSQFAKRVTSKNLCSGPNMLCQSLGIPSSYNHELMAETSLKLYRSKATIRVLCAPRIGIPINNLASTWRRRYVLDDPAIRHLMQPLRNEIILTKRARQHLSDADLLSQCDCGRS